MNSMARNMWFQPKGLHTKRILFHAINHIGLGHLNRAIALAQWLSLEIQDLQFLFLIEGGQQLISPTGLPWILVPGQQAESELAYCERLTRKVLSIFQPDLVVHDTLVRSPILIATRDAGISQVLVGRVGVLLRSQFEQHLDLINMIDLLLIPHQRKEVTDFDQALFAKFDGRITYTGPIVRQQERVSSENLRQRLGLSNEHKIILLTLGGGGWDTAIQLLDHLLMAKERILEHHPQTKLIVITGPHFSGNLPEIDEFVCYVSHFEPLITDYLNIASAVVCMAGYNTVNEIAASGIPAVCVGAPEADDQVGHGSMAEYAKNFPNIEVSDTNIEALAHYVTYALTRERDLSAVRAYHQQSQRSVQLMVDEFKQLLIRYS